MKSILDRIVGKIRLWIRFYKISENFWEIVWLRIVNMLRLDSVFPYDATIRLKNGAKIYYGPFMDLSAVPVVVEIWDEQIYTPEPYRISGNDVVFDLGANVGNFALWAGQKTSGKVYAFEPVPKNFELMSKNVNLNNSSNVIPVQSAVTDKVGTAVIHVSKVDTAHSVTHHAFAQEGDLTVHTTDLETFCNENNIDRINFIKIDCEGAEYDIVEHMSDAMLARIDTISMEHHERFVKKDHRLMSDRFIKAGFKIKPTTDHFIFASRIF